MIDVHCHLTGGVFPDLEDVLFHAKQDGVSRMICSGFNLESSYVAAEIAKKHEGVYFVAGFHPSELADYKDGDLERLRELCKDEKCVAVGEIGLDYHYDDNPSKETQKELFIEQLKIADELGLPVVVHSRDAALDTLTLLKEQIGLLKKGGLLHCYSYSAEMVREFAELGFYFSFGGPITFKNANKVQEACKAVPAHRLLTETDCPYLTPVPKRGEFPNEPRNVKYVYEFMTELLNISQEALEKQVEENAKSLFFKLK